MEPSLPTFHTHVSFICGAHSKSCTSISCKNVLVLKCAFVNHTLRTNHTIFAQRTVAASTLGTCGISVLFWAWAAQNMATKVKRC